MKKMTIHSDGFGGSGTIIVDEEGNQVEGVTSATVFVEANEPTTLSLDIKLAAAVITGTVTSVRGKCPCCNKMLEHQCEEVLGVQPDDNGVMTFKIQEITSSTGVGLFAGYGLSLQGATLKIIPQP